MDEASLAALRAALGDEALEGPLLPVNVPVVSAFLAIGTQWRTASLGMGGLVWIGLDYAGARAALDALQIPVTSWLWKGLVIMEQAAKAALNAE